MEKLPNWIEQDEFLQERLHELNIDGLAYANAVAFLSIPSGVAARLARYGNASDLEEILMHAAYLRRKLGE